MMKDGTVKMHTLVDPTTQPRGTEFDGVARLGDIRGKRVGLIDDSKTNARELLEDLASVLDRRYGIRVESYHRKPTSSKPADPSVIKKMAADCDFAIVAIGD